MALEKCVFLISQLNKQKILPLILMPMISSQNYMNTSYQDHDAKSTILHSAPMENLILLQLSVLSVELELLSHHSVPFFDSHQQKTSETKFMDIVAQLNIMRKLK